MKMGTVVSEDAGFSSIYLLSKRSTFNLIQKFLRIYISNVFQSGLPWWLSGKEHSCQRRRCEFSPWVEDVLEKEMTTRFLCPWDFPGKNTGCAAVFLSSGSYGESSKAS